MDRKQLPVEDYTVGWICAVVEELTASRLMFDEQYKQPDVHNTSNIYLAGKICGHNTIIVCLPDGQIGTVSAAGVAKELARDFQNIRFCLMVGIGGGVPSAGKDIRLGDVVVSKPEWTFGGVVQYRMGIHGPRSFERIGALNSPPAILLGAVTALRSNIDMRESHPSRFLCAADRDVAFQRFKYDSSLVDKLFEASYLHQGGADCSQCDSNKLLARETRPPNAPFSVHVGTIASDNELIENGLERDRVSKELGGVLCFEMEAAGLMNNVPCLVIRGLCDWSDSHRNKTWQSYAALTASATAKEILSIIPTARVQRMETLVKHVVTVRKNDNN